MLCFSKSLRVLLFQKIKENKLQIQKESIEKLNLIYAEKNSELRYFFNPEVVDKLPEEIINEIEAKWINC